MIGARIGKIMGVKPAPIRDPHGAAAPLRLLVFCDRPSASQEVHLFRPLRRARAAGACALAIYSEATAAAQTSPNWIAKEIERFQPHALLFSRFAGGAAQELCDAAHACGLPIITHLDDFLLEVSPDVGAAKAAHHMRPERVASLTASLRNADLLYISTAPLAEKVRGAGFGAPIIVAELQSCADESELAPPPEDEMAVRIGYQGTGSHLHDLALIAPALVAAMQKRPHATLALFGTIEPPANLLQLRNRLQRMPPASDYAAFLTQLRACRWHIGLAPLRDTEFNSFRTYTKWTEYSIAGAAVLASDCAPYRAISAGGAGVLVRDGDWTDALLALIDDAPRRRNLAMAAQAKLRTELTLARQETQVRAMLRQANIAA